MRELITLVGQVAGTGGMASFARPTPRGEGQPKILPVRLDRFSDRRMPCLSRPILRMQRQTGVLPFTLRQLAADILKETGWDLPPLALVRSPRMARCAGLFVAEKDARGSGSRSGSPSRSCGAWAGPIHVCGCNCRDPEAVTRRIRGWQEVENSAWLLRAWLRGSRGGPWDGLMRPIGRFGGFDRRLSRQCRLFLRNR